MGEVFSQSDQKEFQELGISSEAIRRQIEIFQNGPTFLRLEAPCAIQSGIIRLTADQIEKYSHDYERAQEEGRAMKFVPASGAASRMFHELLEFFHSGVAGPETDVVKTFFQNLSKFAFYSALKTCLSEQGSSLESLLRDHHFRKILKVLLEKPGLNLSHDPKALIPFHNYGTEVRTPLEEQIVEAFQYIQDQKGHCRIHFTVGLHHDEAIQKFLKGIRENYFRSGRILETIISHQEISTSTLAVDLKNQPFRLNDGKILFRPGGHGALLPNLNRCGGDIIFIKNIDNVATDPFKEIGNRYKKALGGLLMDIQQEIFKRCSELEKESVSEKQIQEYFSFAKKNLGIQAPEDIKAGEPPGKINYLRKIFNRPLRVCGMVPNVGEPGGGPFWVRMKDGSLSCQIVEASEVDIGNPHQKGILAGATHFNPVDLVCGLRDFTGRPFDLLKFRDDEAYFISQKSFAGRKLKALEWPGLWNGGMAYWNTLFVEVPLETFTPVKTVNDLLRKEHQIVSPN